jgi:hypothetical protein
MQGYIPKEGNPSSSNKPIGTRPVRYALLPAETVYREKRSENWYCQIQQKQELPILINSLCFCF